MSTPLLAAAIWVFLAPGFAVAGEDRREARELRDEAYRRLLDEDYAGGIERLEAAYARVPNPGLLLNVVIAYRQWPGHCLEAYDAYERFEAACGPECTFRRDGAQQLAALDAKCQATVTFSAHRPTPLFVDGKALGRTPRTVRLRPGPHEVQTSTGATFAVEIAPETTQTVLVAQPQLVRDASPPRAGRDAVIYGLAGFGGAALVVGATFTGLAVDAASTLSAARDDGAPLEELDRLGERQDRDAAVAAVGWSVAAASGAAALVLHLTRRRDAASRGGTVPGAQDGPSAPLESPDGGEGPETSRSTRPAPPAGRGWSVGLGAVQYRF